MVRKVMVVAAALGLLACDTGRVVNFPDGLRQGPQAAVVDPALWGALATAGPTQQLEVIVNYDAALTTTAALTGAVQGLGAGVIQFKHLSMLAALATPSQIGLITALPGVQSVYLNRQLNYLLAESVVAIKADQVHASGVTGKGQGVAILDSGIDGLYSPDLVYPNRTIANVKYLANSRDLFTVQGAPYVAATLFVENLPNSETSVGHGTHVAGIAGGDGTGSGGKYTGVAPGSNLVGIGTGDVLFVFWALAGFDYVLDHQRQYQIKAVNNSWGGSGAFDPNDPINEATKAVHDAGVTVVFAAGNDGPGENTLNPYSVAPWVIGVAAGCKLVANDPTNSAVHCADPTGQGRDGVLADFSSRGIPGDALYHPTLTAPGVHIVSTRASTGTVINALDVNHDLDVTSTCAISTENVTHYTCASGTSMASPHVAGVVALMQEVAGGALTPDQVRDILIKTAAPLDRFAEFEAGAGYLDALAAVKAAKRGH